MKMSDFLAGIWNEGRVLMWTRYAWEGGTMDDEALADKLAPLLWEADDWWYENRDKLVATADWAECVFLYMMPRLRKIMHEETEENHGRV